MFLHQLFQSTFFVFIYENVGTYTYFWRPELHAMFQGNPSIFSLVSNSKIANTGLDEQIRNWINIKNHESFSIDEDQ